jgi:hypothetical protein
MRTNSSAPQISFQAEMDDGAVITELLKAI